MPTRFLRESRRSACGATSASVRSSWQRLTNAVTVHENGYSLQVRPHQTLLHGPHPGSRSRAGRHRIFNRAASSSLHNKASIRGIYNCFKKLYLTSWASLKISCHISEVHFRPGGDGVVGGSPARVEGGVWGYLQAFFSIKLFRNGIETVQMRVACMYDVTETRSIPSCKVLEIELIIPDPLSGGIDHN